MYTTRGTGASRQSITMPGFRGIGSMSIAATTGFQATGAVKTIVNAILKTMAALDPESRAAFF